MMMQVREDEEVKAQLIQRIDNLTADNDCLKSEMDLVRSSKSKYILMLRYVALGWFQKWPKLMFCCVCNEGECNIERK